MNIHTFNDTLEYLTPPISCRLQGLVQGVYGERCRLRKKMADLDASEREALKRLHRKV